MDFETLTRDMLRDRIRRAARARRHQRTAAAAACGVGIAAAVVALVLHSDPTPPRTESIASHSAPAASQPEMEIEQDTSQPSAVPRIEDAELLALLADQGAVLVTFPDGQRGILVSQLQTPVSPSAPAPGRGR